MFSNFSEKERHIATLISRPSTLPIQMLARSARLLAAPRQFTPLASRLSPLLTRSLSDDIHDDFKPKVKRAYANEADGVHAQISQDIAERVSALAQLSATAGIGGCVCSPLEVAALRAQHPEPFALVTPGIHPQDSAVGDQVRVMTPPEAIAAGASQLVIGRPITQSEDPSGAFAQSCASLEL